MIKGMHLNDNWVIFWIIVALAVGYWANDLKHWLVDAGWAAADAARDWAYGIFAALGVCTAAFLFGKWLGWW